MTTTDIVEINIGYSKKKTAYKIYIDYEYVFLLYKQDIKVYQLEIGTDVTLDVFNRIIEDTVFRRAKQKSFAILKHMDRTENELYKKLRDAYYTDDIIDRTITYLKEYNYINDKRYASNFIRVRKDTLSIISIKTKLMQKGINKELLEKIIAIEYDINEYDIDPEIKAINKAILKKCKDTTALNWEDKQKLIASLYRKGFDLDKIQHCINKKTL